MHSNKVSVIILHSIAALVVVCIHIFILSQKSGEKEGNTGEAHGGQDIAACKYYRLDEDGCLHRMKCGKYNVVEWIVPEDLEEGMFETWCGKCFSGEDYYYALNILRSKKHDYGRNK